MKQTLKTVFAMMAGTMALAACSEDAILENNETQLPEQTEVARKHITFTAMQEDNGATRAAISSENATQIVWTSGDNITVLYCDASTTFGFDNVDFSLTNGAGSTSGTFTGSVLESVTDETVYTALYPRYAKNEEHFNMTWDKLTNNEKSNYKRCCVFQDEVYNTDVQNGTIVEQDFDALVNFYYEDRSWEDLTQAQQELYDKYFQQFNLDNLNYLLNNSANITQEEYDHIFAYANTGQTINHSITLTADGKVTDVVFPAIQTATEGSFDPAAGLMMAQAEGEASALEFKNVASYFKFVAPFNCRSVSIIDNARAGKMAGTVTLAYNAGEPTAEVTANSASSITLTGTIEQGKTYYIATLPQTFSQGIEMAFVKSDGTEYVKRTSSSYTLGRNKVSNMGTPAPSVINTPYVTFSAASSQTLTMSQAVEGLEYSVGGSAWATLGTSTVTFGGMGNDLRLRGTNGYGTTKDYFYCPEITFGNDTPVACTGDIRTLVDYINYETASTANARFCQLFSDCSQLTSAPLLPATTLAEGCYFEMFWNCTGLEAAPSLPATELADNCYQYMFRGCSRLTTAPALPATTMKMLCYDGMFQYCTRLTTAPTLPATTLVYGCYNSMFSGCSKLNYVNAAFTTTPSSDYTRDWLDGVAATGTFVKNPAATWDVWGVSGVPEGWTVQVSE